MSFTLRELVWRERALGMEEWDRIAWLIMHIPSLSKRRRKFEDVQPRRRGTQAVRIAENYKWIAEVGESMPDVLTNEQIEELWHKVKADMKAAKSKKRRRNDGSQ